MRRDVAQNPTVAWFLPEPGGPLRRMDAIGAETARLDYAANGSGLDELPCLHRRPILEALTVHDRVDPLRLCLNFAGFRELLERRDSGLVGHVVLAVLHDPDANRGALFRNRRTEHEL